MKPSASSGHKLGQLIGDWFEEYFVLPLLQQVEHELRLFLDSRYVNRSTRGEKIIWSDLDGNSVDYDFVLEIGGTESSPGIPVGFIESFWRRGSRHSKDKARDDTGKLVPMRETYPTARFLGIVAAGDFTQPARDLVRSRDIELFYLPKQKLLDAFRAYGLEADYPDQSTESEKLRIASEFEAKFTPHIKSLVATHLLGFQGRTTVDSYVNRIRGKLSVLPQEFRFILRNDYPPVVFEDVKSATEFLLSPSYPASPLTTSYIYQVSYSDGSEFEKPVATLDELRLLHDQITVLVNHMSQLTSFSLDA